MSVAYYIETEDPLDPVEIDVDGKLLARMHALVDDAARSLGLPPLDAFYVPDDDVVEEFDVEGTSEPAWFDASEGVRWFVCLADYFREIQSPVPRGLVTELSEFARLLKRAEKKGVRWRLGLDY